MRGYRRRCPRVRPSCRRHRIDRKHEAGAFGGLGDPLGDDAGLGKHAGRPVCHAGQRDRLDRSQHVELLGVDDRRPGRHRDHASGISGTAAARNNCQSQFDTGTYQARNLVLGIRGQHHERQFDAPVGRIGHVRYARKGVESDVVGARQAGELPPRAFAHNREHIEVSFESRYRFMRALQ